MPACKTFDNKWELQLELKLVDIMINDALPVELDLPEKECHCSGELIAQGQLWFGFCLETATGGGASRGWGQRRVGPTDRFARMKQCQSAERQTRSAADSVSAATSRRYSVLFLQAENLQVQS